MLCSPHVFLVIMSNSQSILVKSFKEILFFAVFGLVLTVAFSFLRPLEYSSSARFLVIQKNASADAYAAIKSVETITDTLQQVVHTTAFFNSALSADPRIRTDYFHKKEAQRRKQWQDMVETHSIRGTGFLQVSVYHSDAREARKILQAISDVLIGQGWQYVSTDIKITVVDSIIESTYPVRPNLIANALGGLVIGSFLGVVYALLRERKKR